MTTEAAPEMPDLNRQNGAVLGRMLEQQSLAYAQESSDGRMHATLRIPADELVWDPQVLVMPHGGDLELEIFNDDLNTHCILLPSNGDRQFLWLKNHARGTASINLDGPGHYWFNSPIGNDEGRGLVGAIAVLGDTPPEARLDRPHQPQP